MKRFVLIGFRMGSQYVQYSDHKDNLLVKAMDLIDDGFEVFLEDKISNEDFEVVPC